MSRAFTMIEILVVIAIIALLAGLGLYMTISTLHGTFRRSEAATIVSLLERARSHAMANIDESEWGVCYLGDPDDEYIVFKGAACDKAKAADTIAANVAVAEKSGFDSANPFVVFSQLSGNLDSAFTPPVTITVDEEDGRSSTITINHEGTILW